MFDGGHVPGICLRQGWSICLLPVPSSVGCGEKGPTVHGTSLSRTTAATAAVVAFLALSGIARADIVPTVDITDVARVVVLLGPFALTLVVEAPIVILPLRRSAAAAGRLVRIFVLANAISCAAIVLALIYTPSQAYDATFILGEIGVTIFEAAFVASLVKRHVVAEHGPPRSHPWLPIAGLVVAANVVTGLLVPALGWVSYALGLKQLNRPPGALELGRAIRVAWTGAPRV